MINELVQTGTRTIEERYDFPAEYDEQGNLVHEAYTEVITREVPVMEVVYREETAEELAEREAEQAEFEEYERTRPRTTDERLDAYAEDTDAALFDLDEAQTTYADETDAALFELVDYIATLESRIEALEGING